MRLRLDRKDDALHFRLDEREIVESEEVHPGVVIGMEMLGLSTRTQPEMLRVLQFETA
jgi:hypothetical protein